MMKNKKRYLTLVILLISANSFASSNNSFSFWQNKNQAKTISSNINFTEGVNLQEFEENFSITNQELRNQYINEAIDLMQAGALGSQAMNMVLNFDDRAFDRRQVAKKGLGKTLLASFRAGIESFYQANYQISNRKLQLTNASSFDYSAHLHYGIYPTHNGQSAIYAFIELTNQNNYLIKSFYVKARAQQIDLLGQALATRILHDLHKTEYPLETKLNGQAVRVTLSHLNVETLTQFQDQLRNAKQICRSLNSKLISKPQIETLMAKGIYNQGHSRGNLNQFSYIFEKGVFWNRDPYANQVLFPSYSRPTATKTMVFCIKNI